MGSDLVPVEPPAPPARPLLDPGTAAALVEHWLAGRSPRTVRAYQSDLGQFARYCEQSPVNAISTLLSGRVSGANVIVLSWRNHMLDQGLATATIARRLAALRSLVDLAGLLGLIAWSLGVQGPKVEPRRDVRGPDPAERKKLWRYLRRRGDQGTARRDRALCALLFDLALRRAEVVGLDRAAVDLAAGSVQVRGKGHREPTRLTLPAATRRTLADWIAVRGDAPGPLFDLTSDGLAYVVRTLGRRAGLSRRLRPHGLRHAAITAALESGSDIRQVRRYSRHTKLETVIAYDDARDDTAGEIAERVSRERK